MKRLPLWALGLLAVLGALFVLIGALEIDHLGPLPLILGILWILFVLASAPRAFADG